MTNYTILSRITRDIADGLIVLDTHGTIVFANPMAGQLLGSSGLRVGEKYAALMLHEEGGRNDEFHQFLLDAVYDKRRVHGGRRSYTCPDGTVKTFDLTCSFLFGEDGTGKDGVVIQFSDVTREEHLRIQRRDTARGFIILMATLCVWIFFYAVWELLGQPIATGWMTILVEVIAIGAYLFLRRLTTIRVEDMGLRFRGAKRAIVVDGLVTAGALALMLAVKACILRFSPATFGPGAKLLDFSRFGFFDAIYPFTVVLQEFLTRGVMHETIMRLIPGKNADAVAIIVSSLFFGALHVYLGVAYMVGAAVLLGMFGVFYRRQGTIWGLCIPHYFLGIALKLVFGFG